MNIFDLKSIAKSLSEDVISNGLEDPEYTNNLIIEKVRTDGMNPHEATRIAEAVNHAIRGSFYSNPDMDQTQVSFPLAEPEKIIIAIKKEEDVEVDPKLSEEEDDIDGDFSVPPKILLAIDKEVDLPKDKEEEIAKEASARYRDNLDLKLQDAQAQVYIKEEEFRKAASEFFHEVEQALYEDTDPNEIVRAGKIVSGEFFTDQYNDMVDSLDKEAKVEMQRVEPELINRDLDVKFVVNDVPLIIKLKKYEEKAEDYDQALNEKEQVEMEIEQYDEKDWGLGKKANFIDNYQLGSTSSPANKLKATAASAAKKTKPPGFGSLAMNVPFAALSAYTGYKGEQALRQYQEDQQKNPQLAKRKLQEIAQKHPGVYKRFAQQAQGKWLKNTKMNRANEYFDRKSADKFKGLNSLRDSINKMVLPSYKKNVLSEKSDFDDGLLDTKQKAPEGVMKESLNKNSGALFGGAKPATGMKAFIQGLKESPRAIGKALPLTLAGGALIGIPALVSHIRDDKQRIGKSREANKVFMQIIDEDPNLKQYVTENGINELLRNFKSLKKFAPDVASDPALATSFLRQNADIGDTYMPPDQMESMLRIQSVLDKSKPSGDYAKSYPSAVTGLGKLI